MHNLSLPCKIPLGKCVQIIRKHLSPGIMVKSLLLAEQRDGWKLVLPKRREPQSFKTSIAWFLSVGKLDGLLLIVTSSSQCHRNRNLRHLWHFFHFYNETTEDKFWKRMIWLLNTVIPRDPLQFSMPYIYSPSNSPFLSSSYTL